jgi:hypothetical protein
MIPFDRRRTTHLRVACQIVHLERTSAGTLIDLVTLEPTTLEGQEVASGTPFALGFEGGDAAIVRELDATMRRWEQACAVLDVAVDPCPGGLRYEFATGHNQVVVTVSDGSGIGS